MEPMQNLRCPRCKKKLAELQGDYFNTVDEKKTNPNQGKLFIKCPKCKEIIEF